MSLLDPRTAAFASVSALFVVTPGVGTAVLTRVVLDRGRKEGLATVGGLTAGSVVYALTSALGLAALLLAFPRLFRAVQLVGGGYVGWLGITTLVAVANERGIPRSTPGSGLGSFRVGLATSLLNPMLAVFYLTVVPQFIAPGDDPATRTLQLAGIHIAIAATWLSFLAIGLDRMATIIASPRFLRALRILTGSVLVALAVRLFLR